jgi:hypothetical protein
MPYGAFDRGHDAYVMGTTRESDIREILARTNLPAEALRFVQGWQAARREDDPEE